MRATDSHVTWGTPLRHLTRLANVEFVMLFPPDSVGELLGTWMGAGGPCLRTAAMTFSEPATRCIEDEMQRLREAEEVYSDDEGLLELAQMWEAASMPVQARDLCEWLDTMAPNAVARMRNFSKLACTHPRCVLVA
jgi:hypothetical protein